MATTLISSVMVTAIRKVHGSKGPWNTGGGWEYNASVIAAMTALADQGPGRPSVDARLFPRLRGASWAALSLGAAVAGSFLATSPPVNDPPTPETRTGRFAREPEPVPAA
jgi:putative oxidoreductase